MADAPTPVPTQAPKTEPSRFVSVYSRIEPLMPWLSLALSVVGVVLVDRSEARGPWVAGAAALGWVVLVLVSLAHRSHDAASTGALRTLARFATASASLSLLQLSLFFSGPFYFEASAWTAPQCAFGVVFALTAALTFWDPWCSRVLVHPVGGPVLMAFGSFVGWNAALPMLGFSQRTSVWIAAVGVGVMIPSTRLLQGARGRTLGGALLAGVLIPTILLLGGIRAIPPAPLRVVRAAIGTRVQARELRDRVSRYTTPPAQVVCFTAIRAPLGLHDALDHVWTLNGTVTARVALRLRGGRRRGFRTWSRQRLSPWARGTLRCDVVTKLGQQLGGTSVELGP